jgi:hypothetical protein
MSWARNWLVGGQPHRRDDLFLGFGGGHAAGFVGDKLKPGQWCDVGARYPCPDGGAAGFSHHGGWNHGWESHIFWNQNKLGPNDNIYLRNGYEGDTVNVITNVKPTGSGWTPAYDVSSPIIGSRHAYVTHYTLKKNDKPVKGANEVEYIINTRPHSAHGGGNLYYKKDVYDGAGYRNVPLADGGQGDPCPGARAGKKGFVAENRIKCVYDKGSLGSLQTAAKSPDQHTMYNALLSEYCKKPGNETHTVGNVKCTDNTKFMDVAKRYCETGAHIKDVSKDAICGPGKYGKYHESAINYCNKNPTDNWCRCYTAMKKCTKNMNGPGCQKFKTVFNSYKKFKGKPGYTEAVNAIPCAAGCSLADVYRPRDMGDCPQNITICNAEVNVGSMQDSTVKVDQACSSGSTDPKAEAPPGELVDYGAQPTLTDFASNPRSYIPKSLGDLKQNRKAKAGVTGIGSSLIITMCCVVLLLLMMSGGGNGPRRFRK